MPLRTLNVVSRAAYPVQVPPLVIAAGVSTSLTTLPNTTQSGDELVAFEIFNAGANNFYYCYGATCDNITNYNAFVVPGQMLEVSYRGPISVYSVGGTTISFTVMKMPGL